MIDTSQDGEVFLTQGATKSTNIEQSKQYLTQHSLDDAHTADIFALASTSTQIISASGSPNVKIHNTSTPDFPIAQVLESAHSIGVHHLALSRNGTTLVSVGFSGDVKIWRFSQGIWKASGQIAPAASKATRKEKAGELWAPALSSEGDYLVGTTYDGRVNVWELQNDPKDAEGVMVVPKKFAEWETRGGFGLAVDVSPDNTLTATSHPSGNIYIFNTSTTRLTHSLPTQASPVRVVKFSPGGSLLAAAGDAGIISLYDPRSGEAVANIQGHEAWITSLDWSHNGEYLLSGSLDGKVKIWNVESRMCVTTLSESEGLTLWSVKWLPKGETSGERMKAERFTTAGNGRAITVYREASGGA